jgi:hypothetical protein
MFDSFINRCKEFGENSPEELSGESLSIELAKIIVNEKILDDDAFELAKEAYDQGKAYTKWTRKMEKSFIVTQ